MPEKIVKSHQVQPFKQLFNEAIDWFSKELETKDANKPFVNNPTYSLLPRLRKLILEETEGLELNERNLLLSITNKYRLYLEKEFERLKHEKWIRQQGIDIRKATFQELEKTWNIEWGEYKDKARA